MKPLSQLKKELAAIRQEKRYSDFRDPRIKEAYSKLSQVRRVVDAEFDAKIKVIEEEVACRSKGPKEKPVLPPEALAFLKKLTQRYAGAEKMTLEPLYQSFYIWHSPGSNWSDNGGQHYGQASHKVVDLRNDFDPSRISTPSVVGLSEVFGRLTKAKKDEWLAWAKEQP